VRKAISTDNRLILAGRACSSVWKQFGLVLKSSEYNIRMTSIDFMDIDRPLTTSSIEVLPARLQDTINVTSTMTCAMLTPDTVLAVAITKDHCDNGSQYRFIDIFWKLVILGIRYNSPHTCFWKA